MRELRLVFGAGRNQSNLTMAVTGNLERASGGGHAVVVMAKAPLAGAVKSRLAPPLGAEEAAELNRCFLRDLSATIERAIAIFASAHGGRAAGLIAYAPAGAESAFDGVTPPAFRLIAQRGENLTARLIGVCEDLFAAGHASVTLMNSDSPTLPARILVSALTAMSRAAPRHPHPGRLPQRVGRRGRRRLLPDRPQTDASADLRANHLEYRAGLSRNAGARGRARP
jgi:hypothetical protein